MIFFFFKKGGGWNYSALHPEYAQVFGIIPLQFGVWTE